MNIRTLVVAGLILIVALVGVLPALAAADMDAALDYLGTQQNADGGFGSGFSPDSTVSSTADAVHAIIAAGGDPASFAPAGATTLAYLADHAAGVDNAGDLAKMILALVVAGQNPRTFGGVDSVQRLEGMAGADGKIGTANDTFFSHVMAVLALASVERPLPAGAVTILKEAQQENGAWAWDGTDGTAADTNTTAFVVQALIATGEPASGEAVSQALDYYASIQNEDGGWPYQNPSEFGTDTDANSTAVTIQALIAAGEDPAGAAWTTDEGGTPVAMLESLQNASGAFAWQMAIPSDNLLATVQALPALAGKAFPMATMGVGEAAAQTAPQTVPETGAAVMNPAWLLAAGGSALAAGGALLRRQK
ncbi:MAG: terpene cyclase/mutase family protein [Anaerolineae bacterium]|nr:terpene cyclase/mutase family protein [Anaerolineae bacterium]